MGGYDEFSIATRLFLKTYRWRRIDPTPWAQLSKPAAESRVALLSSGGFVMPGQKPFDEAFRGGDYTFRTIPSSTDARALINTHRSESFDPSGIADDPNVAIPIDRMRELERDRVIGELSPRVISFMGSITAPARLVRESAPAISAILHEDRVDAAILVPI
jgi:D-proline reductase (dithiol) PrdB